MFKQLLTASSVLVLLLVGSVPAAYAQTQQKLPQGQTQLLAQAEVSNDDLEKFARAIEQLWSIEQQSQARIAQAIEEGGFTEERFGEIYQATIEAQRNPQAQPNIDISQEEQQKFEQVVQEAIQIQQESQEKQEAAVANQGLDVDRFNEIFSAIQQNPQLQEQVKTRVEQLMDR